MREVTCPNCGKAVVWSPESRWLPFCSERCRLIDLGAWFGEEHAIPGEVNGSDATRDPDSDPQNS
jgi:uncharacterized protein